MRVHARARTNRPAKSQCSASQQADADTRVSPHGRRTHTARESPLLPSTRALSYRRCSSSRLAARGASAVVAMHTAFLRANVVFFFAVSVLFLLSIGCGAQYFVKTPEIPCAIGQPEIARLSDRPQRNERVGGGQRRLSWTRALAAAVDDVLTLPLCIHDRVYVCSRQYYRPAANWEHAQGSFHLDAGECSTHLSNGGDMHRSAFIHSCYLSSCCSHRLPFLLFLRARVFADFRPMWNWNTMQVFVYVVVEWESDMRTNRVVVWDREIQTPKDARINQVMVRHTHEGGGGVQHESLGAEVPRRTAVTHPASLASPFLLLRQDLEYTINDQFAQLRSAAQEHGTPASIPNLMKVHCQLTSLVSASSVSLLHTGAASFA